MSMTKEPVFAFITGNTLGGNPTGLAGTITYTGTIYGPSGYSENVFIGRPVREIWAPPIHVYPLAVNSKIVGYRVGTGSLAPAHYEWEYVETPFSVPCNEIP